MNHRPSTPHPLAGILPWQSYFLAAALGVFAIRYPVPSVAALLALYAADAVFRGRDRRLPVLAFLVCAILGWAYGELRSPEPPTVPKWVMERTPAEVQAVVERVETRPEGRLRIVLQDVVCTVNGETAPLGGGLVWNWRTPDRDVAPGQRLKAVMRVLPVRGFGNAGAWDYAWYWQRQGVAFRGWPFGKDAAIRWGDPPDDVFWDVKTRLRGVVAEAVGDTRGGAMVLAMVAGDRFLLDADTGRATRAAGLAHTLALSGLHVGFVAAMGYGLAWLAGLAWPPLLLRIPRQKLAVILGLPLVAFYAWLGQPSASLLRAAAMFFFWGALLLRGRDRVLMDGLFFALAAILLVDPLQVFDLSLQMSAVAVAGIGVAFSQARRLLRFGDRVWARPVRWACELLALSLCANLALLPLISGYFGVWSPNILLNLLWLPALGLAVMPLGLGGMFLSAFPWTALLGGWALGAAAGIMDLLLAILTWTGDNGLTPVFQVLRPLWPEVLGVALLTAAAVVAWGRGRARLGLAGAGFALMMAPHALVMIEDAQKWVSVSLIDVGLGQAAVIKTPGGRRWLVDGGGGSSSFDLGEAVVAPALTHGRPPRLAGAIMSHPDVDHSHGLPHILSRFDVGGFYTNGMNPRGRIGERLNEVLERKGIEPTVLTAGQTLQVGRDVFLDVLHPPHDFKSRSSNERSLVMRLRQDGRGLVLMPGDVEKKGLEALLESGRDLRADVLVLPHHGSRSSFSPRLYAAVRAEAALCSNGFLNRYGFPHESVVAGLGAPTLCTSDHGRLTAVWADGRLVTIRARHP